MNEKGLKYHIRSIHKGEGKCKCTEEGCNWEDKDRGNSTNTSSQFMTLETLLCAKLFWRMEVPAKRFSKIPGPSKPMQLSIWKRSLNVIFVTGTSPLRPTEKCTLEGITKARMMKPNISVNFVAKHLTWNLN